jgi:hypothetical protein
MGWALGDSGSDGWKKMRFRHAGMGFGSAKSMCDQPDDADAGRESRAAGPGMDGLPPPEAADVRLQMVRSVLERRIDFRLQMVRSVLERRMGTGIGAPPLLRSISLVGDVGLDESRSWSPLERNCAFGQAKRGSCVTVDVCRHY